MSLYLQPFVKRTNDDALPTAPDNGVDVRALIDELTNRVNQATRKLEYMVDRNALAKILLTDKDVTILGDQVNIVGQVNIVDWIRDISGNPTGGIDPASMTRIVGGRIQTGVIESFNWSVSAGSQFDLDNGTIVTGGSASPNFFVDANGHLFCTDATVQGTITAGSFIQSSVRLDGPGGPTLGDIASGSDIQAALTAGVGNILAGTGSDYRLHVDADNGIVTIAHKDAVFLGTAAAGSIKHGLGITSSGIGLGYNRATDGVWVTSVAIDGTGNATITGTLTAGSIISNSVTVGGVALSTIVSNAAAGAAISDDLKVSGTTILKGVLVPTDAGAVKIGSITWNSSTGALTGGTGIALTEWGLIGANAGTATFSIQASNGNAIFKGDISGGSNIDITGIGVFNGNSSSSGGFAAVHANTSFNATHGIIAYGDASASSKAVYGVGGNGTSNNGCYGIASGTGSAGVKGVAGDSSAVGVNATAFSSSFTALQVVGRMTINNSTLVTNLNADQLDGKQGSQYCQIVVPTTGTCTVSGNGFNLISTVAGVRTRGDNSNGIIIESTSDLRLKRNVRSETLGLDFILGLKPVTYELKSDDIGIRHHGFISQQVGKRQEFSENDSLYRMLPDGMWSTDYNSLLAPIVKAIQELSAKLNDSHIG